MHQNVNAYLVGGGIGTMAVAAFRIRDGGMRGENISILEATSVTGGSLVGAGEPMGGYSLRGGRMLTIDFNRKHRAHSMARLVDHPDGLQPVRLAGPAFASFARSPACSLGPQWQGDRDRTQIG